MPRTKVKRDPHVLAPYVPLPPVRCVRPGCGDPRLIHGYDGHCKRVGCECTEYQEAGT